MMSMKLTKSNIDEYLDELIEIDAMYSSKESGLYSREIWDEKNFKMDLNGKWDNSWIVKDGNNVLAFSICSMTNGNTLHIHRLAVHRDYKATGVSDMLMYAIGGGIIVADRITLMVTTENVSAVRYYKRHGFDIVSGTELIEFLEERNINAFSIEDRYFVDSSSFHDYHYMMQKMIGGKNAKESSFVRRIKLSDGSG